MAYIPQTPFGIFDRAAYKSAFINKFGADRWEPDHEGTWQNITLDDGTISTQAVIPDMPLDVYQWLREIGWPIGLWSHMATRMTNDLGSSVQLYTESAKADITNAGKAIVETAADVAKTSSKFALGTVVIGAALIAFIFRDDIKQALTR